MSDEKILLRTSQVTTFLSCSAKYAFQYVDKVQTAKPFVFAFGTSLHSAFKKNYGQKIESQTDLPVDEVIQEFSDTLEKETEDVDKIELLSEPEAKDVGVAMVRNYQNRISPGVQPLYVETPLSATWKGYDVGITGTPDLLTDKLILKDYKSSKKKYAEPKMSHRIQGTSYKMLFNAKFQQDGSEQRVGDVEFDLFIKSKNPEIVTQKIELDQKLVLNIYQSVGQAIAAGVAIPNRESFLCTVRFCQFSRICEAKYGGKVKP
jgi:ferredoxin-fold anticodon binding domain-containing protein